MELFHLALAALRVVVANDTEGDRIACRPLEFSELQTLLTESKPLIVMSRNIAQLQPCVFT